MRKKKNYSVFCTFARTTEECFRMQFWKIFCILLMWYLHCLPWFNLFSSPSATLREQCFFIVGLVSTTLSSRATRTLRLRRELSRTQVGKGIISPQFFPFAERSQQIFRHTHCSLFFLSTSVRVRWSLSLSKRHFANSCNLFLSPFISASFFALLQPCTCFSPVKHH